MGANVLSFDVVSLVCYNLSGLSVMSSIFQIDGQIWLVYTFCISDWISCVGPPYVRICVQTEVLKELIIWLWNVSVTFELYLSYLSNVEITYW